MLSAGSYVYKVIATTPMVNLYISSSNFSVAAPAAHTASPVINIRQVIRLYGKALEFGTITSNLPLNTVTVSVYYTNGTATNR